MVFSQLQPELPDTISQAITGKPAKPKTLQQKIDDLTKAYEEKFEELSDGKKGDLKGSLGNATYERIKQQQIGALQKIKSDFSKDKQGLLGQQSEDRMEKMLEDKFEALYKQFSMILNSVAKNGGKLTEKGLAKLQAVLKGVSELPQDKDLEDIFKTLVLGEKIGNLQFDILIQKINPIEIDKTPDNLKNAFEASKIGVIISLLNDQQKVEFTERICEISPNAPAILEALTVAGVLTLAQLKGLIDDGKLKTPDLKAKIENGSLGKKQQEIEQFYEGKARSLRGLLAGGASGLGIFGDNQFETGLKLSTAGIGVLWGLVTSGANIIANIDREDVIASILKGMVGPYSLLGGAVALGSASVVAPSMIPGVVNAVKEFFEPDPKAEKERAAQAKLKIECDNYPYIAEFLAKNGADSSGMKMGFQLCSDLRDKNAREGKSTVLTFAEISAACKDNPTLSAAFEAAKHSVGGSEEKLALEVNKMLLQSDQAAIRNEQQFLATFKSFKKKSDIKNQATA